MSSTANNNFRQFAGSIGGQDNKTSKFPTYDKFEKDYMGAQNNNGSNGQANNALDDRANRNRINEATLRQAADEYNRSFEFIQAKVEQSRQRIKDFDQKQEDKKVKVFDEEIVRKVERVLQNRKSASHTRTLIWNTVPRQTYLYQRYREEGAYAQRHLSPHNKQNKYLRTNTDQDAPENEIQSTQLIKVVHDASNVDMEFSDIEEGMDADEISPLSPPMNMKKKSSPERRNTMFLGEKSQGQNENLRKAILSLQKHQSFNIGGGNHRANKISLNLMKNSADSGRYNENEDMESSFFNSKEKDSLGGTMALQQADQLDRRLIKGIPIRTFIDEVKRQDRARKENEGTFDNYPIKVPGIGLHAIKAKQKAKEDALVGKPSNPKFRYQREIAEHFLTGETRFKKREKILFEQMEDLLDDERIRKNADAIEQDDDEEDSAQGSTSNKNDAVAEVKSRNVIETNHDYASMPVSADCRRSQTTKNASFAINERDSVLHQGSLPPVGSFGLIKDLVRDYTDLTVSQQRAKKKQDIDSLKAYPGTKICHDIKLSKDKVAWQDRKSRSIAGWGSEQTNQKKSLFRQKGLRENGCGRFNTSTKSWLEGYEGVKERFNKVQSQGQSRVSTAVGQAMFNLKRSMPTTAYADANSYIRQPQTRGQTTSVSTPISPGPSNRKLFASYQ